MQIVAYGLSVSCVWSGFVTLGLWHWVWADALWAVTWKYMNSTFASQCQWQSSPCSPPSYFLFLFWYISAVLRANFHMFLTQRICCFKGIDSSALCKEPLDLRLLCKARDCFLSKKYAGNVCCWQDDVHYCSGELIPNILHWKFYRVRSSASD